jgi:hypothetical protein
MGEISDDWMRRRISRGPAEKDSLRLRLRYSQGIQEPVLGSAPFDMSSCASAALSAGALTLDTEEGNLGIRGQAYPNSSLSDAIDVFIRQSWETCRLTWSHLRVSTLKSPLCLMKNRNHSFLVGKYIIRTSQRANCLRFLVECKRPGASAVALVLSRDVLHWRSYVAQLYLLKATGKQRQPIKCATFRKHAHPSPQMR